MSSEEFLKLHRTAINGILANDNPLKIASRTAHKDMVQRIFEEGKRTDGGNIGQYDTKHPLYVNPNTAPRKTAVKAKGIEGLLPTQGKTGEHLFKNGKEHKTTYVKNYKDLRNRIGRRIDKVNLNLTGDLQLDISNGRVPTPVRISQHEYHITVKRGINSDKIRGNEKKYGKIFSHSTGEINKFQKIAELELRNEFSKSKI